MEKGMATFVKQTIGMYRSGFDSRRMLLQVVLPLPSGSLCCEDLQSCEALPDHAHSSPLSTASSRSCGFTCV